MSSNYLSACSENTYIICKKEGLTVGSVIDHVHEFFAAQCWYTNEKHE